MRAIMQPRLRHLSVSRVAPKTRPAQSTSRSTASAEFSRATVAKMPRPSSVPVVTTMGLSPEKNLGVALPLRLAGVKSSRSDGASAAAAASMVGSGGGVGGTSSTMVSPAARSEVGGGAVATAASVATASVTRALALAGFSCVSHLEKNQRSTGRGASSFARSFRNCRAHGKRERCGLSEAHVAKTRWMDSVVTYLVCVTVLQSLVLGERKTCLGDGDVPPVSKWQRDHKEQ